MLSGNQIADLIHSLQRLYSQFAGVTLHRRIYTYHKDGNRMHRYDLGDPLSTKINTLVGYRTDIGRTFFTDESIRLPKTTVPLHNDTVERDDFQNAVFSEPFNSLSEHFKKSRTERSLSQEVGEKLRHSTWEHIRAAIRLAREGNVPTATMHADIANTALKEAGWFMSETTYLEFLAEVKAEFDAL